MLARKSYQGALIKRCYRRLLRGDNAALLMKKNRFLSTVPELNLHQQCLHCVPVTAADKMDGNDREKLQVLSRDVGTDETYQSWGMSDRLTSDRRHHSFGDNIANSNHLLSMSMSHSSATFHDDRLKKTSELTDGKGIPSTLTSVYPFSMGLIKIPGVHNPSFHRKVQSIILRAENNTMQIHKQQNHYSFNSIRSFASASPSTKQDNKEEQTTTENLTTSSSEKGNLKTLPKSSPSSSQSPFSTAAVVETNDSWSATKMVEKSKSFIISSSKTIASIIIKLPGVMLFYLTHPREFKSKLSELVEAAKKEAHHYYMGSKLLAADIRTARHILGRTLEGNSLSRRERKQLLRTVTDLFRVVPMSIFVLVPFLEFALPFALKLFPNMLPSTFQDSLKAEEAMKKELKTRLAMAEFFQETLQNLAKEHRKRSAKKSGSDPEHVNDERQETAVSFLEFINKARKGEMIPPDVIIKYSSYFKDELTLDNIPRMQLVNMCKYMNILPYGSEALLRFQLRHKIRTLQEDDQRILWEGIDSLTKMELREACQERGMRSTGLSKDSYKRALQQWLDLSVNKNVPISLLIMSRTFFLRDEMARPARIADESKSLAGLADTISGLDKDVVNEVILEVATSEEKSSSPEVMAIKLEVLETQNELIEEENKARDAAAAAAAEAKKKAEEEKLEKQNESIQSATAEDVSLTSSNVIIDPKESTDNQSAAQMSTDEQKSTVESQEAFKSTMPEKADDSEGKEIVSEHSSEEVKDQEEDKSLSSEEISAISELLSPDPVSVEKEALERIKARMAQKEEEEEEYEKSVDEKDLSSTDSEDLQTEQPTSEITFENQETRPITDDIEKEESINESDKQAEAAISMMDEKVAKESEETTTISFSDDETKKEKLHEEQRVDAKEKYSDEKMEKVISRLKEKVESMVGKIEIQLSDVEAKIGDKLHILDKDMDGVLSREEMAITLQSVLKRKLTVEEAMEITKDMDENEDGFFSIEEFNNWVETNKVVKLVKEGRDAEVDRMISIQESKLKEKQEADGEEKKIAN